MPATSYGRLGAETGDLTLQMPQNGIVADRHAKTLHQSFSRPPARAVADEMNKFSNSLGPTSVRTNNLRQLIRKCPTLTLAVQTSPTAHPHLHDDDGALHGQVLKMPEIPAVPTCRLLAASGTGAYFRSRGRDHPAISVSLGAQNPYAPPWSSICFASHARAYRRPCIRSNQPARKGVWLKLCDCLRCGLSDLRIVADGAGRSDENASGMGAGP
jgi:hypothetical protein